MEISKSEAEENRVIAHYSRVLFERNMHARMVRRTTAKGSSDRVNASHHEKQAFGKLIGIIESINKKSVQP